MEEKEHILFVDSGVGGISILSTFLERNVDIPIIYYADVEHFPYGSQKAQTIVSYLEEIYKFVSTRYKIKMLVIACNTASVSAIDKLRAVVSVPVVGTVPAIKVAAKSSRSGRFGVIATETSVSQNYLPNLVREFASDKEVFIHGMKYLATAIEENYEQKKLQAVLQEELSFFNDKDIDSIVIGCTHYSFARKEIYEYFGGNVDVIDSRDGVTRRILSILGFEQDYGGAVQSLDNKIFISDKSSLEKYDRWCSIGHFSEVYVKDGEWKRV